MIPSQRRVVVWLCLALGLGALLWWRRKDEPRGPVGLLTPEAAEKAAQAYFALEAREQAEEGATWPTELDAERREDEFLRLWDTLNANSNSWPVLATFPFGPIVLPELNPGPSLIDGTQVWRFAPGKAEVAELAPTAWTNWVQQWPQAGWALAKTTWALTRHRPANQGVPAQSELAVTAQLENPGTKERATLRLSATLVWRPVDDGVLRLARIEVREGELLVRNGPVAFRPWLAEKIPAERSIFTDPLLLWDLDGNGLSDLVMVGADRVWRNRPAPGGERRFIGEPWLGLPAERVVAAVRADVNGDGHDDLVLALSRGISWWPGQANGGPAAGNSVVGWIAPTPLKHPQVITAGDVDGDGDLDLWVAQYKLPYQGGQFPTPWDDANDGFPAYLLLNDGTGHFTDATDASGLASFRFRRTYSASFIDLDLDGDLDLVNVSDFAGLDVYLNQGQGHFKNISDALGVTRHAFGMSHVVGDLNHDGRPDLLMLGMNSTVADRLGGMGLERGESSLARLREMTFGNRLFLGQAGPLPLRPAPPELATGVARTGWTWGAAWADLNQDGYLDLAVANGHETRASVRDYERQFWLHDRFVGNSRNDPVAELYFRTAAGRRLADQASYGGWQSNMLLLDESNQAWTDVAWLWGIAVPADSRNLLVDDLDGDGRLDLVVTTQEAWPERRQRLLVFHNELPFGKGIGFRLMGSFPSGARVELETSAGRQTGWCLTGDGYRSQGAPMVHFGLGSATPQSLRVTWPGRATRTVELQSPGIWERLDRPRD